MTFFKIMHINIRGIRSKKVELENYLNEEKPDIVSINESFLKPKFNFEINGYNILRKDRIHGIHGGVTILIKDQIIYKEIKINLINKTENEYLVIEAFLPNNKNLQKTIIASIYCPKGKTSKELIDKITKIDNDVLIMGDFNGKHKSFGSTKTDSAGKKLIKIIEENNLFVINDDSPTHYCTPTDQLDTIDYIFLTNNLLTQLTSYSTGDNLRSDHFSLFATFGKKNKNDKNNTKNIKLYHKTNWEEFNNNLSEKYNNYISEHNNISSNINEIINYIDNTSEWLTTTIVDLSDKHIPKKNIKIDSNPLPQKIRDKIKKKRKIRRTWLSTRDKKFKEELNKIQKEIKKDIINYNKEMWEDTCNKINTSKNDSWKYVKKIMKKETQKDYPTLSNNNNKFTNDIDKTNAFKEHLEEIFNAENTEYNNSWKQKIKNTINTTQNFSKLHPTSTKTSDTLDPLYEEITIDEINLIIKNINIKKSCGEDTITNKLIKLLKPSLSPILHDLYNLSFKHGYIPQNWKNITTIMIPKPGKNRHDIKNYRPISLINCLEKILEKIITDKLLSFVNSKNIINKEQSGFQKYKSTNDQLFQLTQSITQNFNRNHNTAAVFLDIDKAFDRVWHDGLRYKLLQHSVPTSLVRWISDFLKNRKIKIKINNTKSKIINPVNGVPQGSSLSPLLFLIYVADLPNLGDKIKVSQFADDLALWATIKPKEKTKSTITESLQEGLTILKTWCDKWRIGLNADKTKLIVFSKNKKIKQKINIEINGKKVKEYKEVKFLGVTFDPSLQFEKHMDNIITEIRYKLITLYKIKSNNPGPSTKSLIHLFNTYIRSKMEYGNPSTIIAPNKSIQILQTTQNRFLRYATNSRMISTSMLLNIANQQSIKERIKSLAKK